MSIAIDVARDANITRLDAEEPRLQRRCAYELCGTSRTRAANAYKGVRTHRGFATREGDRRKRSISESGGRDGEGEWDCVDGGAHGG